MDTLGLPNGKRLLAARTDPDTPEVVWLRARQWDIRVLGDGDTREYFLRTRLLAVEGFKKFHLLFESEWNFLVADDVDERAVVVHRLHDLECDLPLAHFAHWGGEWPVVVEAAHRCLLLEASHKSCGGNLHSVNFLEKFGCFFTRNGELFFELARHLGEVTFGRSVSSLKRFIESNFLGVHQGDFPDALFRQMFTHNAPP